MSQQCIRPTFQQKNQQLKNTCISRQVSVDTYERMESYLLTNNFFSKKTNKL